MSPDWAAKAQPVPYARLDNPQTLNLYAYVANNPLSKIDPDGHYECAGSKDQCAQIQTALNLAKAAVKDLGADSKQGKAIQKVIDLYGDAGKKNGVNVSFGKFENPNVTGEAARGKDGSINIKFDLSHINAIGSHSQYGGASMFGERVETVIHEGTHGLTSADGAIIQSRVSKRIGPSTMRTETGPTLLPDQVGPLQMGSFIRECRTRTARLQSTLMRRHRTRPLNNHESTRCHCERIALHLSLVRLECLEICCCSGCLQKGKCLRGAGREPEASPAICRD